MINFAGDWDFQDSSIKCFADHEQASVFNVQLTSDSTPIRVLTFSYERALAIVAEEFSVPIQPRPHNRELHQETGNTL